MMVSWEISQHQQNFVALSVLPMKIKTRALIEATHTNNLPPYAQSLGTGQGHGWGRYGQGMQTQGPVLE